MANKAWVTLVTNDTYGLGALVLAHSLKKVNTTHKLVVLISSDVTFAMRGILESVYDEVKQVDILDSKDAENLRLLARPELGITFTKLHCWKLTHYEKCVFLDADTLVLQNCDELFEREELSAAPDIGWPDCFNSGVFVFKPSEETFKSLLEFAVVHGSFDGGDQGLLNMYFKDWAKEDANKRLPFLYNLSSAAIYSYLPAFKWYGRGVKIVHFIGNSKPWLQPFNPVTSTVEAPPNASHLQNFLQYWWDLFCSCVHQHLSPEMAGLANSLSQMKIDEATPEQKAREDFLRRQNWEHGNIDYMGRDSFNNIWEKISETMNFKPETKPEETTSGATKSVIETATPSSTAPDSANKVEPSIPESCPKPSTVEEPLVCPRPPAKAQSVDEAPACPKPTEKQPVEDLPSCPRPPKAESAEQPSCPRPPKAESAEQPSCPRPPKAESAEQPSCPRPPKAESAEQPSCPRPPKVETAEQPSCPRPPKAETAEPPSCPRPPKVETAEPPSCPRPPKVESAEQPSCPRPPKAEPTEPALCPKPPTAQVQEPPSCPKPAADPKPVETPLQQIPPGTVSTSSVPVSVPPQSVPVESQPAPAKGTPQIVEKQPSVAKPSGAQEASQVCQKPTPSTEKVQTTKTSQEVGSPAEDPKTKGQQAPAKPSGKKN